jgi:hypothetical protein
LRPVCRERSRIVKSLRRYRHTINITTMKSKLKLVDQIICAARPTTMDELINVVHSIPEISNNGTHFRIVKFKGYTQGIRVYVTGRKISHPLPGKDTVYSIFKGLKHFEEAGEGWIEHQAN